MAITVHQNLAPGDAGVGQGASVSYTPPVAFTPGRTIIIVFTSFSTEGLATSVTVGGNAATRDRSNSFGTDQHLEIWRVSNLPSAGNVVVNWAGAGVGNYVLRGILEVSGLENSGVVDQNPTPAGGTGTGPSISTAGATTQADELVVALMQLVTGDATITQPGSYTSIMNNGAWSTDAAGAGAYRIVNATGVQTATWTLSASVGWAAAMVTYKGAATSDQTISGAGNVASAEAFGTQQLRENLVLTGIASLEAFGTASVSSALTLLLSSIASLEGFGTASVLTRLGLSGVASAEAFGTPALPLNIVQTRPGPLEPPLNIIFISDSRGAFVPERIETLRSSDTVQDLVVSNATSQYFIDHYGDIQAVIEPGATNVAVILLGLVEVNDGLAPDFDTPLSAAATYALLETLVGMLDADGVYAVVCTQPDCGEFDGGAGGNHPTASPGNRETVRFELDDLIRADAAGGIGYIDLAVALPDAYDETKFSTDRIHPVGGGQDVIAEETDAELDELEATGGTDGLTSQEAFGTALLRLNLLPPAIASLEAHGTQTVTPAAVTVTTSGIASGEAHGTHGVLLSLALAGVGSLEGFGTNVLGLNALLAGIASEEAVPSPLLATGATVAPTSIASLEDFGTAVLEQLVAAGGILSAEAFGTLAAALGLNLSGIASLEQFGTQALTLLVLPSGVASLEQVGTQQLTNGDELALTLSGIASGEAHGSSTVTPAAVTLTLTSIASLEVFGTPALLLRLEPASVPSGEAVPEPTLAEVGGLVVPGITSGEVVPGPTVTPAAVSIAAPAIPSAEAVPAPALGVRLELTGLGTAEAFGSQLVELGEATLVPVGIVSLEVFGQTIVGVAVIARASAPNHGFLLAVDGVAKLLPR